MTDAAGPDASQSESDEPDITAGKVALGQRLREARRRAAMTQDDLATRVGKKKNWLSDIERGRRGIDVHTLQRIADLLGRSIESFTNPNYDDIRREMLPRPATRDAL